MEGYRDARHAEAMARLAAAAGQITVLRIEARIPHLVELFTARGIEVIVLKGPVTRMRLYGPEEDRPTADIDLLVPPGAHRRATRAVEGEGYERVMISGHSDTLRRGDDYLDLHLALPYSTASPRRTFRTLRAHVTTLTVAGCEVPVLDEAAHVVHLALHAAQSDFDPAHRSLDEYRRGIRSLSPDQVREAGYIAARIGAEVPWGLAQRALDEPSAQAALVSQLPARKPGSSFGSMWSFLRSPIPTRVRWRAARGHLHRQVSDEVVNAWRRDRGLPPIAPGTLAIRTAKLQRLVAAAADDLGHRA